MSHEPVKPPVTDVESWANLRPTDKEYVRPNLDEVLDWGGPPVKGVGDAGDQGATEPPPMSERLLRSLGKDLDDFEMADPFEKFDEPRSSTPEPMEPETTEAIGEVDLLEGNLTDLGYAERIKALHGDDVRWVKPWSSWLAWDGKRWVRDDVMQVELYASQVARKTFKAFDAVSGDEAIAAKKKALMRESSSNIRGSLEQFKTLVAALPEDFDSDRWALNVANGTVDLRNGRLRPHSRSDMITRMGGVSYNPRAECPRFRSFLAGIFAGDQELISHVQKLVGMTLAGEVRDHVFTILFGLGANGKTAFIRIISSILGDYACKVQPETLTPSRKGDAGAASPHLARLAGYRFACCDETEDGAQLAEGLIKRLTGGDRVVARGMYRAEAEFDPQLSLWLDTNHKPAVPRGGHAIWRRIQLIPFTVTIAPERQVPNIAATLIETEGPGILRWAVEGCLRWQAEGLNPVPEAISRATESYREDEDKIGRFVLDECDVEVTRSILAAEMYGTYRQWCLDQGLQPEGQPRFSKRLAEEHGVEQRNTRRGRRLLGIDLKAPETGGGDGPG